MPHPARLDRRSLLLGGAGLAGAVAGSQVLSGPAGAARSAAEGARPPLWRQAQGRGIVFGSSTATWQLDDGYRRLFDREAAMLFTEDDLLWYQLKPKPNADLNFEPGDTIFEFAEGNDQLVIGAHLVWDEGFGRGWKEEDLWGLSKKDAEKLLYGVISAEVAHYKGRPNAWVVANEVTSGDPSETTKAGFRTNVPWYQTIGVGYVAECFHIAKEEDPDALLLINEFGFETTNEYGDSPYDRQRAYLRAIDTLLDQGVPVEGVGIQGHLLADRFAQRFNPRRYRAFLGEIADRGLPILVTELDVLDEGLPKDVKQRDRAVAEVYRRYLDATLDEKAVKVVSAFGLTDRYTWLDEDQPRDDGAHRRPLAFDRRLKPKPAQAAISRSLAHAPKRDQLWELRRS